MANRILKESIRTNKKIYKLSWFEEVFFYRLITAVDDYGIYYADPPVLAHTLFPLCHNVTLRMTEAALDHLEQLHLITRYTVGEEGYFLKLVNWEKHQRVRNSRRKFPAPEEARPAEDPGAEPHEADTPEAEEPETDPEEGEETDAPSRTEADSPVVITLPLNDGSEFPVTQKDVEEFAALYPAVDIDGELRAMRIWCLTNAKKRKTRAGILRFITGWMGRAQDKSGTPGTQPVKPSYPPNPYLDPALRGEGFVV